MTKKVEVLANIAVIITAMVLCSILVKKYSLTKTPPGGSVQGAASKPPNSELSSDRKTIQPGTQISLPGIDWTKSNRTVLLALSTTCHFCTESAAFYQRLQQRKPNDVQIVAVFPQPVEDSRNYLNKLGVSVSAVVQAPLASVNVLGTPTLMLIDNSGAIKDSWVGKLPDSQAAKVIEQIGGTN